MRPFTRTVLFAALLLFPVPSLHAQTAADPSGHWEGTIQAPGMDVRIEIDLAKNGKGELAGTFGQLDKTLKGLLLSHVAVEGKSVTYQVKGPRPGERAFSGVLSADGQSMFGDYTQVGYSMPFNLTRIGAPRIEAPVRNAPIGKELEGTWNGTLDFNGTQRRLVLTMSNQPDGTATGAVVNVDEALEIPIATITQKASSVILEVKAIGGSYSGDLNPDGSELVGTLTEGPVSLPLTFRRILAR